MLRGLKGSFLISLKLIVRNCNKAVENMGGIHGNTD